MQQIKTWLNLAMSLFLLWGMWAYAADTVLFDPESYQVNAPVGQGLVIVRATNSYGTWKYATGNGKLGSLTLPMTPPPSFEISTILACNDKDTMDLIDRQCASLSLVSGNKTFKVEITRYKPAGSSYMGNLSTFITIIDMDGITYKPPGSLNCGINGNGSFNFLTSVNAGIAKLYINGSSCIELPVDKNLLFNSVVVTATPDNEIRRIKMNDMLTYGTYADGLKAGMQRCVANPTSCGIPVTKIDGIATNGLITATNKMIAGVLISGGTKRVLVRASSVDGSVDPAVEIYTYPDRKLLGTNDSWNVDPSMTIELTQKKLAPARNTDAATMIQLAPGLYTMEVSTKNGNSGATVLEVYDMAVFP
ncbi:MAG: hypothetical protein R3E08_01965 [Thiotrichaceae bacterium]